MRYTIEWLERKETSTGKKKIEATVKDESGVHTDVTIWADFPSFEELKSGETVEGEIRPASDPKYRPSLNASRTPKTASSGAFKQKVVEEAMQRKEQSISRFQGEKELSIKISSTFRAAVDTAIAEYQEEQRISRGGEGIEAKFKRWREFYWGAFDVNPLDYPPF